MNFRSRRMKKVPSRRGKDTNSQPIKLRDAFKPETNVMAECRGKKIYKTKTEMNINY